MSDEKIRCPECGNRRREGWAVCRCGYVFCRPKVRIAKNAVMGMSPMTLPEICVKCGQDATGGERIHTRQYIHTTSRSQGRNLLGGLALGAGVPAVALAASRKTLEIKYSICRQCIRVRWRKVLFRTGVWLLSTVALFPISLIAFGDEVAVAVLITLVLFGWGYPALALRRRIWISTYKDEVFTVKGMTKGFYDAMKDYQGSAQPAKKSAAQPKPRVISREA